MTTSNPVTPLTAQEKKLIAELNDSGNRENILAELKRNLQIAVEIELATIPIYLYTYYSIKRNKHSGQNIQPMDLFANKAGGIIMSVAVEEMLHMSLSSNVLFSLGVEPQLYRKAPSPYPTELPFHNPVGPPGPQGKTEVKIPLAKLGYQQLWHFLQIEYPESVNAMPSDCNWDTIGQFYSYIRCLICTDFITDADFCTGAVESQIQDYNYSPNNIDTVHPSGKFDSWSPAPDPGDSAGQQKRTAVPGGAEVAVYSNSADSHAGATQLLAINSKETALQAIDTICDQGEGMALPTSGGPAATDDESKSEDSHYYKFLKLQAQFDEYKTHRGKLSPLPEAPDPITPTITESDLMSHGVLVDYPDNPRTSEYPKELQPISDFCNGCFQYMLIMTETVYRVAPEKQQLFFNEGLHRSMIWVLDKYIQTMRGIKIGSGIHQGKYLAATFENTDLGDRVESFDGLMSLGKKANDAAHSIINSSGASKDLKDSMKNIQYYVNSALFAKSTDGAPMHLPDVRQYWG